MVQTKINISRCRKCLLRRANDNKIFTKWGQKTLTAYFQPQIHGCRTSEARQ